jgi:hypothetical protein
MDEELRQRPCLVGEENVKSGDKSQVEPPSNQGETYKTDLVVGYQCGNEWMEQVIGYVSVNNGCGGCEVHMRITEDCY